MDAQTIEPAIKVCLSQMHAKLKEAEQIARAASACAEAGSTAEAVRLSMGLDQLFYDAGRLQDATCLFGQMLRGCLKRQPVR